MRAASRGGLLGRAAGAVLSRRGYRPLAGEPVRSRGTPNAARVNRILSEVGGRRYLEVGLKRGRTLEAVTAPIRMGVDPVPRFNPWPAPPGVVIHPVTSDEFFSNIATGEVAFDVILIDGLHEFHQAYRDLLNALPLLARGGVIILDDVVPTSPAAAAPTPMAAAALRGPGGTSVDWMGDVFKVMAVLHEAHPELRFATVVEDGFHAQALIVPTGTLRSHSAERSTLESVGQLSYEDVFDSGIPAYFRPMTFESGLRFTLTE